MFRFLYSLSNPTPHLPCSNFHYHLLVQVLCPKTCLRLHTHPKEKLRSNFRPYVLFVSMYNITPFLFYNKTTPSTPDIPAFIAFVQENKSPRLLKFLIVVLFFISVRVT